MAGTITKKAENKWQIRVFLGRDANGKTKHFNKTIEGTKRQAQQFLTAKLRERDLGIFVEPSSQLLSKYLDDWLVEVAKPRVRESTFSSYEMIVRNYVKPKIGMKRLSEVDARQVQMLYSDLIARGLSPRTVRYTHSVLSSAMDQAVKWKLIIQNPCKQCDLPRQSSSEMLALSPDEARRFLEAAKDDKYYALFLLAIQTGMRPEEYLGLQWKDIDFENAAILVKRALVWKRKGGGFYFTDPKTKKSQRSIPISDSLVFELKRHRTNSLERMMKFAPELKKLDLVFTSEVGTPVQPKNLRDRHFFPIRNKAGIPKIRLYDLRHTTATLMLASGENPKVVSERLGHASIVLTLDTYSHVLPTMQRDATERLENLMFGT
ncbi:MAG TPA: site-specific integrase [Pyrinomonadaceae bacterium]|nr:site-specific integrase [Pyrinomonadaceae bacterium]HMP66902.1 site-specific integrase [Pyrinomonadaceae bacterium]